MRRKQAKHLENQYGCTELQIQPMSTSWSVKEVSGLRHLKNQPRPNWYCRDHEVTQCGVLDVGGEMVAGYPSQKGASTGNFIVLKRFNGIKLNYV